MLLRSTQSSNFNDDYYNSVRFPNRQKYTSTPLLLKRGFTVFERKGKKTDNAVPFTASLKTKYTERQLIPVCKNKT